MQPLVAVWVAAAALCIGVAIAPFSIGATLLVGGVGAIGLAVRRGRALIGLALVAFACGTAAVMAAPQAPVLEALAQDVPDCVVSGRVQERAGGLGTILFVARAECADHPDAVNLGNVVVDGSVGDAGSGFVIRGWLTPLGHGGFDGARRDAGAFAALRPVDVSTSPPERWHLAAVARMRTGLKAATNHLRAAPRGLVRGLTIGDTDDMGSDLIESFRRAGLSHLVAVSGSNVAIVIGAVALATAAAALILRVAVAAAALVFFLLMVGPEPSVARAAVMGGVGLVALATGRRTEPLQALGLAMVVVIGARPSMLTSVGLHLSVAATAGIVLWAAPIARRLAWLPRPLALGLAATLAAQAAVAPVLVGAFGQISVVAPLANVLALPAVPPATVLGLASGAVGLVWPGAGTMLGSVAGWCATWIASVGEVLGSVGWAAVEVPVAAGWALAVPVLAAGIVTLLSLDPERGSPVESPVMSYTWTLHDAASGEIRTTDPFATKEEAEAWMGSEWSSLLAEGAESVSLKEDGEFLYRMGLREA